MTPPRSCSSDCSRSSLNCGWTIDTPVRGEPDTPGDTSAVQGPCPARCARVTGGPGILTARRLPQAERLDLSGLRGLRGLCDLETRDGQITAAVDYREDLPAVFPEVRTRFGQ